MIVTSKIEIVSYFKNKIFNNKTFLAQLYNVFTLQLQIWYKQGFDKVQHVQQAVLTLFCFSKQKCILN